MSLSFCNSQEEIKCLLQADDWELLLGYIASTPGLLAGKFVEEEAVDSCAFLKTLVTAQGNEYLRGPPLAAALLCLCVSRVVAANGATAAACEDWKAKAEEWFAKFRDALSAFLQVFADKPCCSDDIQIMVDSAALTDMGEGRLSKIKAIQAVLTKLWRENSFIGDEKKEATPRSSAGAIAEAQTLASVKRVQKRLARLYTAGATLRSLGMWLDGDNVADVDVCAAILRERAIGLDFLVRGGGRGLECSAADDLLLLACGCLRRLVEPTEATSVSFEHETQFRIAAVLRCLLCEEALARDGGCESSEESLSGCLLIFTTFALASDPF